MGKRVTPVQAAKELGIRPQVVYGFLKHLRVHSYPNPGGKAALVDLDEVKSVAKSVKPHRPKDSEGKPVRRLPPVRVGTLLSQHAHFRGEKLDRRPHRVAAVHSIVNDEEGEPSLVYAMKGDGEVTMMYEAEDLADRIKSGHCFIESPGALLGVVMFHWVHNERTDLAAALQVWCEQYDVDFPEVAVPEEKPVTE